ncbi:helix-turn-helix domain-containing protein [Paenibacillus koleovorans]|uniref:helix-turn-helix domain-containing protein n=1 Tax=Paenibacillus koleovorans TaxID=121608 RepID=UPI0013E2F11B|nr:helix-turn-helix domain-containing protein [Paenibacillus koleovorans]
MLKNRFQSKYLQRILVSVTLFMCTLLVASTSFIYYGAEKRVLGMQVDANKKMMSQVKHNLTYMNEIIHNLSFNLFNDHELIPLIDGRDNDMMDVIRANDRLLKVLNSSSFLHSIVVYNSQIQDMYAVGHDGLETKNSPLATPLLHYLMTEKSIPRMQLIPMNLSQPDHGVDFFSFVIFSSYDSYQTDQSALILNVNPEWIYTNLKAVNDLAVPQSVVFLTDREGNVFLSGRPEEELLSPAARRELTETLKGYNEPLGTFRIKDGNSTFFATTMSVGMYDWRVVSLQPYDALVGVIKEMRTATIMAVIGFLLVSVAVSVWISRRLYAPVDRMMQQIHTAKGAGEGTSYPIRDELTYVTESYHQIKRMLRAIQVEKEGAMQIVSNYYLRRLIADCRSFREDDFLQCRQQSGWRILPHGAYLLAVLRIDDYSALTAVTPDSRLRLYQFAISNIAAELFADHYPCECVQMNNEHSVLLFSLKQDDETSRLTATSVLIRLQEIVADYYKLSLTIALSERIEDYRGISDAYAAALHYSTHRLIFGRGRIFSRSMVESNLMQEETGFPADVEKKLGDGLRRNDRAQIEQSVTELFRHLRTFHIDHIQHGLLHLVQLVRTTLKEINGKRVHSIPYDWSSANRKILEQETLEDSRQVLLDICGSIGDKTVNMEQEKNRALMDTVKSIIEANYADMNLSLQSLAYMLRLTPAYVGKLFREVEAQSVSDYINEVRLNQALVQLETKPLSIKEIMERIGYSSESTFFKLFKQRYGVTPKEYRLKKTLEPTSRK